MIVVSYKFNIKAKQLFKDVNVDINKLQRYTTFICNEYKRTKKDWFYDITVKGTSKHDGGSYFFGLNEMEIGTDVNLTNISKIRKWYLGTYFHEICHFLQDNVDKVNESKLSYSEEDVEESNDNYINNKYEIQAREFETKNTDVYLNLFHN